MQTELDHDQEGFTEEQLKPYMEEALNEAIDRLFEGKFFGGFYLEAYVEKFASEVAAKLIANPWEDVGPEIRGTLNECIRRELADSDSIRELAAEMAGGE